MNCSRDIRIGLFRCPGARLRGSGRTGGKTGLEIVGTVGGSEGTRREKLEEMQTRAIPLPLGKSELETGDIECGFEQEILVGNGTVRQQRTRVAACLIRTSMWVGKMQSSGSVVWDRDHAKSNKVYI